MEIAGYLSAVDVIDTTQSVCPVCLDVVEARIIVIDKAVHMEKECPRHGLFTSYLWPDVDHYNWMLSFKSSCLRPAQTRSSTAKECPTNCGLCTKHLRRPTLVELSLTDRCNLRCPVCFMAAENSGRQKKTDPGLVQLEQMYRNILAATGPQTAIQLTGGEPTVRKDLLDIVRLGKSTGFDAIEINTNGLVIGNDPDYALRLAEAGVSGVYLQFDGLTSEVYQSIRGGDFLAAKLRAIENCRQAGLRMVLSMTIISGINDRQIGQVLDFALDNLDTIVGVAYQPAFGSGRFDVAASAPLTMGDVILQLAEQSNGRIEPYDLWPTGCSHPLCDATTYLIRDQQDYTPLTRMIGVRDYFNYFDPSSPQGSVLPDIAEKLFRHTEPGLSILVMNYMDADNMDLRRLRECSMVVADAEGHLVPFCSCQLTNRNGLTRAELCVGGRQVS